MDEGTLKNENKIILNHNTSKLLKKICKINENRH